MSVVPSEICYNVLPDFTPVKRMDFGLNEHYVPDVIANSQYAIASATDNVIRLYDLSTLQPAYSLPLPSSINKIKLLGDQYLFSACSDGKLCRWDLRCHDQRPVQTFSYEKPLTAFDINCDDTMAVVGTEFVGQSADIVFYDSRQASPMLKFDESHSDDITEIQCHPTISSQLLSCSTDGLVNSYSAFDEEEPLLAVINSKSSVAKAGYFGPNAEYTYYLTHIETFAICSIEGDILYDYGDIRNTSVTKVDFAVDCSYDPSTQRLYLITGTNEGQVDFFNVTLDRLQLCQALRPKSDVIDGHTDIVRSIYWNHQTQSLLTGGEDGQMIAWQA